MRFFDGGVCCPARKHDWSFEIGDRTKSHPIILRRSQHTTCLTRVRVSIMPGTTSLLKLSHNSCPHHNLNIELQLFPTANNTMQQATMMKKTTQETIHPAYEAFMDWYKEKRATELECFLVWRDVLAFKELNDEKNRREDEASELEMMGYDPEHFELIIHRSGRKSIRLRREYWHDRRDGYVQWMMTRSGEVEVFHDLTESESNLVNLQGCINTDPLRPDSMIIADEQLMMPSD